MRVQLIVTILLGIFAGATVARRPEPSLWFFGGSTFWEHTIYNLTDALDLLKDPQFNPAWPTAVYTHGWQESPDDESNQLVINSYLQRGGINTLFLDWEDLARPLYPIAMANIPPLGARFAQVLVNLFDAGLSIDTFHLVGHSLGSHLAGFTGRNVISLSNGKYILPRISCLDPAGPFWYGINIFAAPVSRRDAILVDVIHTDSGRFGAPQATGTVDFWPNGGDGIQPGCPRIALPTSLCSHHVSWRLWAESLTAEDQKNSFLAVQAQNWRQFTRNNFNDDRVIQMGINTPKDAVGSWYLHTNGDSPRSRNIGYNR